MRQERKMMKSHSIPVPREKRSRSVTKGGETMSVDRYLRKSAYHITSSSLADIRTAKDWRRERPKRLACYLDRMGLAAYMRAARTPLNERITGILDRGQYRIEKVYFESLPRLYVTGLLYVPAGLKKRAPAVIYLCGHSDDQKCHYQSHARHFCKLGFVALLVETIQLGEIEGEHHGTYSRGQFNWISRGYSPAAVECWNAIRAVDLLTQRPEVDASRIGVTGVSGGGGCSWWLTAADERVKVAVPVCGTGSIQSHVGECTVDQHCDCMFIPNAMGWDLSDVGALIAPRPLLVAAAERDLFFTIESARSTIEKVTRIYDLEGAVNNVRFVAFRGKHGYDSLSRRECFAWFLRHLAGKDIGADDVDDLSAEGEESQEALTVYVNGPPLDERVTTIDDGFIPKAKMIVPTTHRHLRLRRSEVLEGLRRHTFGFIPNAPSFKLRLVQETETVIDKGARFEIDVEKDRVITLRLSRPMKMTASCPVLLALRSVAAEAPVHGSKDKVVSASVETFGIGRESWGGEYAWHVRRSLGIMGRTIGAIRVRDVLCALQALRRIPHVRRRRLMLAARGEMVPVALYAALFDGGVSGLVLSEPPATHDVVSDPRGTGPAIEMQGCLRVTDLPEIAALLWPAELVFIGVRPESYRLTEESYGSLGLPGVVRRLKSLDKWHPASDVNAGEAGPTMCAF